MYEFLFRPTIASFVFTEQILLSLARGCHVVGKIFLCDKKGVGEKVEELTLQLKLFKTTLVLDVGLETSL